MYDLNGKQYTLRSNNIKILQDIHEDVLENIDRPEIPWEEQKILLKEFNPKNPRYRNIVVPNNSRFAGQTIEKQFDLNA